jgi:hypothetical protein
MKLYKHYSISKTTKEVKVLKIMTIGDELLLLCDDHTNIPLYDVNLPYIFDRYTLYKLSEKQEVKFIK